MIGRLLTVERIKLRRRSAFELAVIIFTGFMLVMMGGLIYATRTNRATIVLPGFWRESHDFLSQIVMLFSLVTVVNLTAPEYAWKTSRQNVIDGLSREQWFSAKLLMVPVVVLLFYFIGISMMAVTGLIFGQRTDVFITDGQLRALSVGMLISTLGYSSLALLASFLTRNTAGAIALLLGYIAIGEQLIRVLLQRISPEATKLGRYLPGQVFGTLNEMQHWDPRPIPERVMAVMREHMGEPPGTGVLLALAAAYAGLCILGSFLLVRRQDL
jgi:ABC-2 type transport system permease protein